MSKEKLITLSRLSAFKDQIVSFISKHTTDKDIHVTKEDKDRWNEMDPAIEFTSDDNLSPNIWTNVEILKSNEKHSTILNKVSTMFKNIRYLHNNLEEVTSVINILNSYPKPKTYNNWLRTNETESSPNCYLFPVTIYRNGTCTFIWFRFMITGSITTEKVFNFSTSSNDAPFLPTENGYCSSLTYLTPGTLTSWTIASSIVITGEKSIELHVKNFNTFSTTGRSFGALYTIPRA